MARPAESYRGARRNTAHDLRREAGRHSRAPLGRFMVKLPPEQPEQGRAIRRAFARKEG